MVFFFFQAEDGIRDLIVTGVQTCALPISGANPADWRTYSRGLCTPHFQVAEWWVEHQRDLRQAKATWARIVVRNLADRQLHREGTALLVLKRFRLPEHQRAIHKWKRVRSLVAAA